MIEARFDDLVAGAERAFRLVEPVGVIEARRPSEVAGGDRRGGVRRDEGAVGGGVRRVRGGARPRPRAVGARQRPPDDPFAELPLAWFALFERKEDLPPLEPGRLDPSGSAGSPWRPSVDRATYDATVERIRELIAAGHTYQVNHTIRLRALIRGDERGLYRDLCLAQRGGYGAFLDLGRYRVLSASPELFFRVDGVRITTRPMKGTAPRGRWLAEDEQIAARLVASSKERAENAMIVDLLRNDLGRICRTGSVEVERMLEPERYETVWQLTSTIEGDLRPEITLLDTFRALFPSGSVTGAPKVRTTRIIADLEDSARGPYCGADRLRRATGDRRAARELQRGDPNRGR